MTRETNFLFYFEGTEILRAPLYPLLYQSQLSKRNLHKTALGERTRIEHKKFPGAAQVHYIPNMCGWLDTTQAKLTSTID